MECVWVIPTIPVEAQKRQALMGVKSSSEPVTTTLEAKLGGTDFTTKSNLLIVVVLNMESRVPYSGILYPLAARRDDAQDRGSKS